MSQTIRMRISLSNSLRNIIEAIREPEDGEEPNLWLLEQLRRHLALVKQRHDRGESAAVLDEFFDLYVDVDECAFCGDEGRLWTRKDRPDDAEGWELAPQNWHGFEWVYPCPECATKEEP